MCVTDASYIAAATSQASSMMEWAIIDTAIQNAIWLWKRTASGAMADMQDEIAKRQTRLAEQIHQHAKKFWPYELDAVNDAFGIGHQEPAYDAIALTWADYNDKSHEDYANAFEDLLEDKCIFITPCERANWTRNRQKDRAQVMYFADRTAEMRAEVMNDKRFAEQYAVLALGRDHLANVPTFASLAQTSYGNARKMLLGSINNALEAFGYYRRDADVWGQGIRQRWGSYDYVPGAGLGQQQAGPPMISHEMF